jgi:hypothetical protein
VAIAIVTLSIALIAIWGALALRYQASRARAARAAYIALWIAFALACNAYAWRGHLALACAVFAAGFIALLLWWRSLRPSNQRSWADDVARTVHGSLDGSRVTLFEVRDFIWRSESDYTPRWVTRSYDLERLASLDMIISYWTGPAIAHMLISFGFEDGGHVVFSVEIRREKTEEFSEVGGFFKEFELSVIAAEERDIVRLRTNIRRERTYLYRLKLERPAMRSLFLAYLEEANSLARTPRFYHTITANCTTLVYLMLRRIVGKLPFSYRVLLSGYLPEYMYRTGCLDRRYPLEQLRALGFISERALQSDQSPTFSADIRKGIPSL